MVAINDFGMPSCCENCNMCNNRNLDTFYCSITLNDVNIDEKAHDCPLVDIEERKVGKWEKITIPICHGEIVPYSEVEGGEEPIEVCKCSYCGVISSRHETNYCPCCGAEMRGNKNEQGKTN